MRSQHKPVSCLKSTETMVFGKEIEHWCNLRNQCFYVDSFAFYICCLERKENESTLFLCVAKEGAEGKNSNKRLLFLFMHSCMSRSKCMERGGKCTNQIWSTSEVGKIGLTHILHVSGIKAD